jgi:UDP-N-acetylmuramyl pentapeptide synthase
MEVELMAAGTAVRGRVDLHARHLAGVVALALAAAQACGVPPEQAMEGVERWFRAPTGRMAPEGGPHGSVFLRDEFKSRPAAAAQAVAALGEVPAKRRLAVLGEIQEFEQSPASYRATAEALRGSADLVVAVGRGGPFLRAQLAGTELADRLICVERVEEAAEALEGELSEGDVVLLHGATRQHLERVKMLLDGEEVGCLVRRCVFRWACTGCPHLRPGPPAHVVEAA